MSQDISLTGIISYPNVFEPKQINGKGDPKYSATLVLDPRTDWNAVQACVQEALVAKFGNQIPAQYKQAFTACDSDPDYAAKFPGQWMIKCYADRQPQVVDQHVNPIMDRSQLFAGCKVNMYVRFYAFDTSGNKGVGVGLNAVQLVDNVNVTRLDDSKDAKDVFKPIAGAPPMVNPTAYAQPPQQAPASFGAPNATAGYPPSAAPPGPPAGAPAAAGYPTSVPPGAPAPGAPAPMPWNS